MKAKWLIEDGALERENWNKIEKYLKETGREVFRTKYRPFSYEKVQTPFDDDDCVVAFGCLGLVRSVVANNKWIPGVWCDWDRVKASHYMAYLGRMSIQKNMAFFPVSYLWDNKEWIFSVFGNNGWVFVRPDDNFKSFSGEVVSYGNWEVFRKTVDAQRIDPHSLCMVSRPSKVTDEWRFIVVDGKIVTGSQYIKNGLPDISPDVEYGALSYAKCVLDIAKWRPHPVFTLDICKAGSEYGIMEIGSVNGAGLYDCDIPKLVEAISEVAEREWSEVYE